MTDPGWFDWLSLWLTIGITVLAAAFPAFLAIFLWQRERIERQGDRRSAATAKFTSKLERLDESGVVLARAKYLPEFVVGIGAGTDALIARIDRELEWAHGGDSDKEIDLAVDVSNLVSRWMRSPAFRADLTEVFLANGEIHLAEEDNLLISPLSRLRAENVIWGDRSFAPWLRGTRLSRPRIFWRKVRYRGKPAPAPSFATLNVEATKNWVSGDEIEADSWLVRNTRNIDNEGSRSGF